MAKQLADLDEDDDLPGWIEHEDGSISLGGLDQPRTAEEIAQITKRVQRRKEFSSFRPRPYEFPRALLPKFPRLTADQPEHVHVELLLRAYRAAHNRKLGGRTYAYYNGINATDRALLLAVVPQFVKYKLEPHLWVYWRLLHWIELGRKGLAPLRWVFSPKFFTEKNIEWYVEHNYGFRQGRGRQSVHPRRTLVVAHELAAEHQRWLDECETREQAEALMRAYAPRWQQLREAAQREVDALVAVAHEEMDRDGWIWW